MAPRRRRTSRDPHPNAAELQLTERDIRIFQLLDPLHRYQYLPSSYIHHFIGGYKNDLLKRLRRLQDKPGCYLYRPPQQKQSLNANYKHEVYRRDTNAETELKKRSLLHKVTPHSSFQYAHELLNCLVDASIECGVQQDPALRLIGWKELSQHPRVPEATKLSPHPFRVPLAKDSITPDGRPFILERTMPDGGKRYLCVLGKEIDRHTEPLSPTKLRNASIAKKLVQYKQLFDGRLYRKHYGFENSLVLIVTTNETHMHNMIELTRELIGPCAYLLFKTLPDYAYEPHFPQPNADLLTAPWKRAGRSDFFLNKLA